MDTCKNCEKISRELEGMKADLCSFRRTRRMHDRIRHRMHRPIRLSTPNGKSTVKKRKSSELMPSNRKIKELLNECMCLYPELQQVSCDECGKFFKNKHSLATHKNKLHKKKIEEKPKPELTESQEESLDVYEK